MVHLEQVEAYVPEARVPIEQLGERLELNRYQIKLFQRIHGLHEICMDEEQSLVSLLIKPLARILMYAPNVVEHVRYLVYCHTIKTVTPYPINVLEEVKEEFGLQHALSFSLTQQNCSSGLVAMELADDLLRGDGDPEARVLILLGEKASHPTLQLIPNTTIMGEAAAALVVRAGVGKDEVVAIHRTISGQYAAGINISAESLRQFEQSYVPTLVKTIQLTLDKANLSLQEIEWILPHNVNLSSWTQVARALSFPVEKIYLDNVSKLGHCFCADSFINYQDVVKQGMMRRGSYYLLVTVGLGAVFTVAVMRH
ncbi:ketoacyl-ACP synthase III family protein [Mechercharimyces sp. CAU 1602]|uniref:ketoacyl-ACP synthase III family protein n=1 Tax=Mechercharimyces sp. CAU 1602 TaxID=2973933 RepID=UPI0021612377|nr:ketoacyl-ACP synthase III family protein [Mechercharimyces sp. CAU 1602]MCS1352489.1 ketoacyl-ACP synthase III family protein [Mechercharimyces sp. CAU 1602]